MESGDDTLARFFHSNGTIERFLFIFAALLAILILPGSDAASQEFLHLPLFREADTVRAHAKDVNADVYAPKTFGLAMDAFNDAQEYFRKGRPVDEIHDKILTSVRYFRLAMAASRPAADLFSGTMAARADAMSADAIRASPELWNKAETLFRNAAVELEEGNARGARNDAGEAQGVYRSAELEAIKTNFLSPARELIARADALVSKTTAPQTLERAHKLLDLADRMIQQNRYDNAEARRLASEAMYEAQHAIYLHRTITDLKAQGRDMEDVFLTTEDQIQRIADALNVQIQFDQGPGAAVNQILNALKSREALRVDLADSVKHMTSQIAELQHQVSVLEYPGGSDGHDLSEQHRKNEERLNHDQTVALASIMFTPEDGVVVRDGNNVILRMYGIQFIPGKETLDLQFSGLLTKVARAIRMFPNCQLSIEGHTESGGTEAEHQRISETRAEAVAAYLRGVLPASTPIVTHGYGSTRPIADNTTEAGRARNRRIDIVITPEWAVVTR
jgi:OOP family OmpA-OmpF porin